MIKRVNDLCGGYYDSTAEHNDGVIQYLYHLLPETPELNPYYKVLHAAGVNASYADDYYFNWHSCHKIIYRHLLQLYEHKYGTLPPVEVGALDQDFIAMIGRLFDAKYRSKYIRLYDVFISEYNPIENYDRYEDLYKEYTEEGSTTTDNTTTNSGDLTTKTQVEGMNSVGFNDSDKVIRTDETEQVLDGEGSHSFEGAELHNNHIHGNIGVTESTTMLEHYADWWCRINLLEQLCNDIDDILTTGYYI